MVNHNRVEPGQESVWDYPRPPRLEDSDGRVKRVLETSHPPENVRMEHLAPSGAAWFYPDPTPPFRGLEGYVAFYPSKVDGKKVEAQPGDFYGGWITPNIVGSFKGGPGTWGW